VADEEIQTPYELPSDPGIKVYANPNRQIVIRQEGYIYDDNDPFIYFPVERADKVIEYIRAVKEEILTARADEAAAKNDQRYVPGIDP
jgi:hypothetical protein